jgi:hypothetical protein
MNGSPGFAEGNALLKAALAPKTLTSDLESRFNSAGASG